MTKKELLASLRPFAAPLPDKDTQLKRCFLAVNVIKPFLDTFEKGIKASSKAHQKEAHKLVAQIAKVRRWHTDCTLSLPVLPRHAATLRIVKNLQKDINKKIDVVMLDTSISATDAYAAWGRVCFEILAEATCTAKQYAKGNAWRHLDTTLHTLCKEWSHLYPNGDDMGTAIFDSVRTA